MDIPSPPADLYNEIFKKLLVLLSILRDSCKLIKSLIIHLGKNLILCSYPAKSSFIDSGRSISTKPRKKKRRKRAWSKCASSMECIYTRKEEHDNLYRDTHRGREAIYDEGRQEKIRTRHACREVDRQTVIDAHAISINYINL